jgi:hypothetical protein
MSQPLIDKDGNVVSFDATTSQIWLTLKSTGMKRNIGRFHNGMLHVKRDLNAHGFKKNNSLGFNYDLLKRGTFKYIIVDTGEAFYLIERTVAVEKGSVMNFKAKGFELQIFVPFNLFTKTE